MPTEQTVHTTRSVSLRPSAEQSMALSAARKNASLSESFLPLMKRMGIQLEFSPVSSDGVCKVDATQNATNAYKIRGALASAEVAIQEGKTTLVTASAGNHGAGIALAAQKMGLKAIVYVPKNAPAAKVKKIMDCGAEVRFAGDSFDECLRIARLECKELSATAKFVHPFDDPTVVAGQGTIGFELLEKLSQELPRQKYGKVRVVLPIGGGGLAAGVLSVLKTRWKPEFPPLEVVGVVDESSPASLLAMLRGRPVRAIPQSIADGTNVEMVGKSFLAVAHLLDGLMLLPHDDLVSAMREHEQETTCRLEGAGALALGGERVLRAGNLLRDPEKTLSLVLLTGKNIDDERFNKEVSAQPRMNTALMRQGFDVLIPEKSGQLLRFLEAVKDFNIVSLTYIKKVPSSEGHLRVEFEVPRSDRGKLQKAITCEFPGSHEISQGDHMVYAGGIQGTEAGTETLIQLEDRPGSFLNCAQELTRAGKLGLVDFLFYRKPATKGAKAQVVMGVASQAVDDHIPFHSVPLPVLQ